MIGQMSPTENLVVKNVLEGAKRRLATQIEKKEPVTFSTWHCRVGTQFEL